MQYVYTLLYNIQNFRNDNCSLAFVFSLAAISTYCSDMCFREETSHTDQGPTYLNFMMSFMKALGELHNLLRKFSSSEIASLFSHFPYSRLRFCWDKMIIVTEY